MTRQFAPPPIPPLEELKWHQRLNVLNVTMLIFLIAVIAAGTTLRGPDRQLDYFTNAVNFLQRMFPPDFSVVPTVLRALLETAQIATVATFIAIVVAFPLAACGAQNMAPRWLVIIVRMILNGVRTVPSLVWAVLAVAIVGPNPLAGVIALTFYSLGYLGKFFSDAFESADVEIARGMKATGANPVQAFQYGIWPSLKPLVVSYSLWMLEYNIRSAAIIGYVGAGGIGVQLHVYQEFVQWNRFTTVLIFILILVTILDFLGEWIRKKVTKKISL